MQTLDAMMHQKSRKRNLEDWRRLELIIRETGMSVNGFALHIGLLRGENLYQIRRGNNGISRDLAVRIHTCFPQFSVGWILTGIGDVYEASYGPYPWF